MNNDNNGGCLSIIVLGFIIYGIASLFTGGGTSASTSDYDYDSPYYSTQIYNSDYYSEPENPYSTSESGHYAGYEWAEENDVDSCDGNSDSFIEGCEEYVSQQEAYDEYESYQDDQQEYDGYYY